MATVYTSAIGGKYVLSDDEIRTPAFVEQLRKLRAFWHRERKAKKP